MRIRKDISPWNFKVFFIMLGVLLFIYNIFYLLAGYFDGENFFSNQGAVLSWVLMGLINPLIMSSLITSSFRTTQLYINDYQQIPDFATKLDKKIQAENMTLIETGTRHVYRPNNWFYKLFNSWSGSENVVVTWGDEVLISGSLRKVSAVEDVLTWNADFRYS